MGQLHNNYRLLMGWGVTFTSPRQLTTYIWQMSRTTPWYTPPWARATRVDAPNTTCNTSRPKLLTWPNSTRGMGLCMCSTSPTLSSSLRVKRLTQRCYLWNAKASKLALTLLNFQGGTKPTNHNRT